MILEENMVYEILNRSIKKIAVIGSGQIGPDIALHFIKVLSPFGVTVVVLDVVEDALKKGRAKLEKKVQKGVESGDFKKDQADRMLSCILFTSDYDEAKGADFVVEAATENLDLKQKIFGQLEALCPKTAIFCSNSSHLEPERIFAKLEDPSRTAVAHYFFPAERNPIVEIVPGERTSAHTASFLMALYEAIGKIPIPVRSSYGYAVDPIFEGLFQAAAQCVTDGLGTVKEVDFVAARSLGLGVGPFTAHNLTGGNPITDHGLDEMHERLGPHFKSPKLLKDALEKKLSWETAAKGEKVEVQAEKEKKIADAMKAAYFGFVTYVLDKGIITVADYNLALATALVMKPAFELMNAMGVGQALALVDAYAKDHPGFIVPDILKAQAKKGPWEIPDVLREDRNGVAVLTIRRPKSLNALSDKVFKELKRHAEAVDQDPSVKAAVLTGYGVKAFVSGADVGFLAKIQTPEEAERTSLGSQAEVSAFARMKKPAVCALNGFAMGGGNEIAMACTARIAKKGLKVLVAQPEVNLGFIPGAGGTQRLPRLVGIEKAAGILRTGRTVSGAEALEIGLIDMEVEGDLRARAVELALEIVSGKWKPKSLSPKPLPNVPSTLPDVELGHLSRAIDAILCDAVLKGAAMSLEEGMRYEAKCFGRCRASRDWTIGVENFLKNGPKEKAKFINA